MIVVRGLALLAAPLAWRSALVLLAAAIAVRELATPSVPAVSAAPPLAVSRAALTPAAAGSRPGIAYPAIAQHPLFSPTRRPWLPPPAPATREAAAPAPPASFTVIGTVIGDGVRRAIVRPPNGDKTIVLAEGQILQGWTLRRIGRERLRFENDGATYELRFPPPRPGQVTQAGR
jgi:hypothetical protein